MRYSQRQSRNSMAVGRIAERWTCWPPIRRDVTFVPATRNVGDLGGVQPWLIASTGAIMGDEKNSKAALVFSGGLGLGSYHTGAFGAFPSQSFPIHWVSGSSAGAVA